jgi:16S rRNA (adenine(1408)-N(1))-methyltransferase
VSLDLGTGDGRLPYVLAQAHPERLFVGIDANAAGLAGFSRRAVRAGLANVVYVRAAVEDLPIELAGTADRVTVVLPWGSLLAAVASPSVPVLRGVRGLCRHEARLSVVLSLSARDRAEAIRLGVPPLDGDPAARLSAGYAQAGFALTAVRPLGLDELAGWPSTWARRLAHGRPRSVFRIDARTAPQPS